MLYSHKRRLKESLLLLLHPDLHPSDRPDRADCVRSNRSHFYGRLVRHNDLLNPVALLRRQLCQERRCLSLPLVPRIPHWIHPYSRLCHLVLLHLWQSVGLDQQNLRRCGRLGQLLRVNRWLPLVVRLPLPYATHLGETVLRAPTSRLERARHCACTWPKLWELGPLRRPWNWQQH